MTVQAGIEVDVDLELIVGEMPEQPCENRQHGKHPQHPDNGPAEFYFKGSCSKCKGVSPVQAICAVVADYIKSGAVMTCNNCWEQTTAVVILLEPIK